MSTPNAAAAPQDPELMQAGFNAIIEALTTQRDGALQGHAQVLSELRVTQVLHQRAEKVVVDAKADLAAAQQEIARLQAALAAVAPAAAPAVAPVAAPVAAAEVAPVAAAESAQTEQPADAVATNPA
jgi:hypothetical protein